MIKMVKERMKRLKIRTKLSLLMLASAVLSLVLFWFLWSNMENVWNFLCRYPSITWDKEALIEKLEETAKYYDVPDSEEDAKAQKAIEPFFSIKDEYTAVYIYEIEGDGLFRAGSYAEIMERNFGNLMNLGYSLTTGKIEEYDFIPVEFHNGEYNIMLYSYHAVKLVYPYLIFSILLCAGVFLSITLVFINKKMKYILCLKDEILIMASGELTHPVPECGEDEIGVLSKELDGLRSALDENIRQEEESRIANRDLITAISHDLRTPLTILNGYLEVLKLKRIPSAMEEEYLERCLKKTSDIKEMTDKMFEYALVFEETEDVDMAWVQVAAIQEMLRENIDFLRLAGFQAETEMKDGRGTIMGDRTMLKRIFNNLFSNILKYGDKRSSVKLSMHTEKQQLKITLVNMIKYEKEKTESNQIGLKSAEKMVELHGGEMYVLDEAGMYTVQVAIPMIC